MPGLVGQQPVCGVGDLNRWWDGVNGESDLGLLGKIPCKIFDCGGVRHKTSAQKEELVYMSRHFDLIWQFVALV